MVVKTAYSTIVIDGDVYQSRVYAQDHDICKHKDIVLVVVFTGIYLNSCLAACYRIPICFVWYDTFGFAVAYVDETSLDNHTDDNLMEKYRPNCV